MRSCVRPRARPSGLAARPGSDPCSDEARRSWLVSADRGPRTARRCAVLARVAREEQQALPRLRGLCRERPDGAASALRRPRSPTCTRRMAQGLCPRRLRRAVSASGVVGGGRRRLAPTRRRGWLALLDGIETTPAGPDARPCASWAARAGRACWRPIGRNGSVLEKDL